MPHDWEVICDETNNSPEDIENNMLKIDITLPAGWELPNDRQWYVPRDAKTGEIIEEKSDDH